MRATRPSQSASPSVLGTLVVALTLGAGLVGCHGAQAANAPRTAADTGAGTGASGPGAEGSEGAAVAPTEPALPVPAAVRTVEIDVHFTEASFADLHPDLEALLRDALDAEARRCPGLAFAITVGGSNYAIEHWVYEADTYLLIFVDTGYQAGADRSVGPAGHFFLLWPGGASRPMTGATLMLGRAERFGSDRGAVQALVRSAVRHAVDELATAYGVRCAA